MRGEKRPVLREFASEMLDSKGTVSSFMMTLREGKIITRSGHREVHRMSLGIVDAPGREQSGQSAKNFTGWTYG